MWFYTYDKSPVILFTLKERCRHVSRGQQHTACVPSGNIFMRRRANWNTVHISKKLTITFVELLGNSCTLPGKKSSAILNCWTAGKVNWFEESYICFVSKVYLYKWTYVLSKLLVFSRDLVQHPGIHKSKKLPVTKYTPDIENFTRDNGPINLMTQINDNEWLRIL